MMDPDSPQYIVPVPSTLSFLYLASYLRRANSFGVCSRFVPSLELPRHFHSSKLMVRVCSIVYLLFLAQSLRSCLLLWDLAWAPAANVAAPPGQMMDVVYTYVSPDSVSWRIAAARHPAALPLNKFRDWNELLFSMRSVYQHVPSLGNVYIVVADYDQVPVWLNAEHPRVRIVIHDTILSQEYLPTFNSYVIESRLHHIPGLSEYFLYMNNDMFLSRDVSPSNWMPDDGRTYIKYSDWPLTFAGECTLAMVDPSFVYPSLCWEYPLFHDAWLSKTLMGVDVTDWYTHTPRMYRRSVLQEVEEFLGSWLHQCRLNRWRNPRTDVMLHVQYESYLQIAHPEIRLHAKGRMGVSEYTFVLFDANSSTSTYAELESYLYLKRPRFVTIDDNLKTTDNAVVEFNTRRLCSIMQIMWPVRAIWERNHSICAW